MHSIHSQPFRRLLYEYLAFHNILGHMFETNDHDVPSQYQSLSGDDNGQKVKTKFTSSTTKS